MKIIKMIIRGIRFFFGYMFLFLASYVIPDMKEVDEPATKKPSTKSTEAEEAGLQHIRFDDLSSYVEKLAQPQDPQSAVVSMLADAKKLSVKMRSPIRLNTISTFSYDRTGQTDVQSVSNICNHKNGRWYKLRDLHMDHSVFQTMLAEMVESQTQDGWACMDDSVEQVALYLSHCLQHNEKYLINVCRQKNTTATILMQLSFVVDMTDDAGKNVSTAPQVLVRVKATVKGMSPMESSHSIYFNRITKTASTLG